MQPITTMKVWLQCNAPYVKYCLLLAYQLRVNKHQDIRLAILGQEKHNMIKTKNRTTRRIQRTQRQKTTSSPSNSNKGILPEEITNTTTKQ
eukprot:5475921-Ditylum_brightwellii.AAC.1